MDAWLEVLKTMWGPFGVGAILLALVKYREDKRGTGSIPLKEVDKIAAPGTSIPSTEGLETRLLKYADDVETRLHEAVEHLERKWADSERRNQVAQRQIRALVSRDVLWWVDRAGLERHIAAGKPAPAPSLHPSLAISVADILDATDPQPNNGKAK